MEAMRGEAARRACALLAVLAAILATAKPALGTKHVVGWRTSGDLGAWASSNTFRVGDLLMFKYNGEFHNVVELHTEKRFRTCDVSGLPISMSGGHNTVKLNRPGTRYFACGQPGHCKHGEKLKITTIGKYDAAPPKRPAPSHKPPAHNHEHKHTPSSSSSGTAPSHEHTPPSKSATAPSSHEDTPATTPTKPAPVQKPSAYSAASRDAHSSTTAKNSKSSAWSLMGSCPPVPLVAMAVLSSTVLGLVLF